jgi:large subunit ribosomal protein L6
MSRIGKKPVEIAEGVNITLSDKQIEVSGKKGKLTAAIPQEVIVTQEAQQIIVAPANDSQRARAMWGLTRSIVQNLVTGVSEGYTLKLEINGVGYRAQAQGKTLKLNLAFSHDVNYDIPEGIEIKTPKPTEIEISGFDKQLVGQVAADIRKWRKPEPYKGKGIKYEGERILRKEGKKK